MTCANKNSKPPKNPKDVPPDSDKGMKRFNGTGGQQPKEMKMAVAVSCKDCKPNDDMQKEDFEVFEVIYCPHVNIMKRVYAPNWQDLQYQTERQKI